MNTNQFSVRSKIMLINPNENIRQFRVEFVNRTRIIERHFDLARFISSRLKTLTMMNDATGRVLGCLFACACLSHLV